MGFAKGHKKVGGRLRGTPNQLTGEAREVARGLLGNAEYQQRLQKRLIRGEAPKLEILLWQWAFPRPRLEEEMPDGAGANGDLSQLLAKLVAPQTQDPSPHHPAAPGPDEGDIEKELFS